MAIAHARPTFALSVLRSAHRRVAAGEARPRRRRAGRCAFGPRSTLGLALVLLFVCGLAVPFGALAQDVNTEEMRSLDERVQSIKSDVLEIAAELTQLEEKLLYPSSTQVAVFVSMAKGYAGDLDSVEIRTHPIVGLEMPVSVEGVPDEVLDPVRTWSDPAAYEAKATELAKRFRENEARFELSEEVRAGGPRV